QDQRRINRADGKIADRLAVVVLRRLALLVDTEQRHQPLVGVLGVFPACPIRFDESLGGRSERDRFGRFDSGGGLRFTPCLYRVTAIATDLARVGRFLTRFLEAHVAERTEPVPARATVQLVSKEPAL